MQASTPQTLIIRWAGAHLKFSGCLEVAANAFDSWRPSLKRTSQWQSVAITDVFLSMFILVYDVPMSGFEVT